MDEYENKEYRNTSTGNDCKSLVKILQNYLSDKSSLLLLGIGSGKDLMLLSNFYNVTGSDFSKLLLTIYQKSNPDTDLITLDPVELKTDRMFDSVFSNKVLHQMKESDLIISLQNQINILNSGGLAMHSFWSGSQEEDHHGLKWVYYTEETLIKLIPDEFEILELSTYKDIIECDSIYMVLRKK